MADTTNTDDTAKDDDKAGDQQQVKAAAKTTDAADNTADESDEEQGAGSKRKALAELAAERKARQASDAKLAAVLATLGLNPDGTAHKDTDDTVSVSELRAARMENAVLRSAGADVDADGLLDSRQFLAAIADVDPSDTKAVKRAMKEFVDAHPRFRIVNDEQAARPKNLLNLAARTDTAARTSASGATPSVSDAIRAARRAN